MHRNHPQLVLATFQTGVSLSGMISARAYLGGDLDVYDDLDMTPSRSSASLSESILSTIREAADLAEYGEHSRPSIEGCRVTHVPTAPFGRPAAIICWRGHGSRLHIATPVPLPHLLDESGEWTCFDAIGRPMHVERPGW